jgi:serine/threonine-protein kinase
METATCTHRVGELVAEKYHLLHVLQIGGMGAVWVAHHLDLDIHVAIKFILPHADSTTARARLLVEGQIAARVHHPAIVQVVDVGHTDDGEAYLAMELLEGEALADVLARERRFDPRTAIQVLLPIAEALEALHRHGIIHRDVKPENIFLATDDAGRCQPKLIDFGLARRTDRNAVRLTVAGSIMGTPGYMSRERLLGGDVGLGEDVYGLTVVLYRAITGALPFDAKTPAALLAALNAGPRSILTDGVGDPELWTIVERGLAPSEQRWPSAGDLGKALAGWLWRRGSLDDIAGVSLRPAWIGDDDLRCLADSVAPRMHTRRLGSLIPRPGGGIAAPREHRSTAGVVP